jgi:hypothetical protein
MKRRRRYRNIVSHITTLELIQSDDSGLLMNGDLFSDLTGGRGTDLFLGQYSKKGIMFALEKLGLLARVKRKGLDNLSVFMDTSRPFQHLFRLHHNEDGKHHLVAELVMRRGTFTPPEIKSTTGNSWDILVVEWLMLQNPLASFSSRSPQLPHQNCPGLGLAQEALEIFFWMGRRARCDGVLIIPNSVASAMIYSGEFAFADPCRQGMMKSIQKLCKQHSLAQVAWAWKEGKIVGKKEGKMDKWIPAEMLLPTSRSTKKYFRSRSYRGRVKKKEPVTKLQIEPGYKKRFTSHWQACD